MGLIKWYKDSDIELLENQIDTKHYEVISCIKNMCHDKKLNFKDQSDLIQTKIIKYLLVLLALKKPYRRVYTNRVDSRDISINDDKELLNNLIPLTGIQKQELKKFVYILSVEWLYDLHWYLDEGDDPMKILSNDNKNNKNNYCPISFDLALECEWGCRDAVKYDFQKLLFCNADLKIIVYKATSDDKFGELSEYFLKAVELYSKNDERAQFVFVAFDLAGKNNTINIGIYSK